MAIYKYFIFLYSLIKNRECFKTYFYKIIDEVIDSGIGSITLTAVISIFIGIVTAIQIAENLNNPILPDYLIGFAVRKMIISELSPTILGIIISSKIGAHTASQISSMKISEQLDALEVFGINSTSYIALPKILASIILYPILILFSIFVSLVAGYFAYIYIVNKPGSFYINGILFMYKQREVHLAIYKAFSFAFLSSSISAFIGSITEEGACGVGNAATKAVTYSCIAILIADYLVAHLCLYH